MLGKQKCTTCMGRALAAAKRKEDEKKAIEAKKQAEKDAKAKGGKKDDKSKFKKN
jgi:hypothetical protein